jgi:radical SAM-linked protein
VSFGLALPTGHESQAEYLDIEVADSPAGEAVLSDLASWPARLSAVLPDGIDAVAIDVVPPGTPSLQEAVTFCTWQWTAVAVDGRPIGEQDLAGRVEALLASPSVIVTRARKGAQVTDDIRESILDLSVVGPAEAEPAIGVRLQADLATQPRSLRPSEVTAGLGADLEERDTRRLYQWISRDGAGREPLAGPPATTDAPHALERAS